VLNAILADTVIYFPTQLSIFTVIEMSVHFKFISAKDYATIPVDGIHISLEDLKEAIMERAKITRNQDVVIKNAENMKEYSDPAQLIPKNTSVLVKRIPLDAAVYKHQQMLKSKQNMHTTNALTSNRDNLINVSAG